MKKRQIVFLVLAGIFILAFAGCIGNENPENGTTDENISNETENNNLTTPENNSTLIEEEIKIKMTVGNETLTATLIDNPSSRNLIEKFPMTLPMEDLYSREMYYSFEEKIPAPNAKRQGYEVGDISLWTPGNGLVIFYEQNGEIISGLQKVGRIDSGVEIFKETGDIEVTFELIE